MSFLLPPSSQFVTFISWVNLLPFKARKYLIRPIGKISWTAFVLVNYIPSRFEVDKIWLCRVSRFCSSSNEGNSTGPGLIQRQLFMIKKTQRNFWSSGTRYYLGTAKLARQQCQNPPHTFGVKLSPSHLMRVKLVSAEALIRDHIVVDSRVQLEK